MVNVILEDDKVGVMCNYGELYLKKFDSLEEKNMWLYVIGAIHDGDKIGIQDDRKNLQDHQYSLST